MTASSGGVSMLERLVQNVEASAPKPGRSKAGLTPTAGEAPMTARVPLLPNDVGAFMSNEIMEDAAKTLRMYAAKFVQIADGLEQMVGIAAQVVATPLAVDAVKAAEKAADEAAVERDAAARKAAMIDAATKDIIEGEGESPMAALAAQIIAEDKAHAEDLGARIERLSKEAQAATFKGAGDDTESEDPPEAGGWTCSIHGQATVKTSARRGRQYRACPVADCDEFERL